MINHNLKNIVMNKREIRIIKAKQRNYKKYALISQSYRRSSIFV